MAEGEKRFVELLPNIQRILKTVVRDRRASVDEAEEFQSYLFEKWAETDYGPILQYAGRASIETYLRKIISNKFSDFRDHKWGKWHCSAAARRDGDAGRFLERYLIRDGLTFGEACEALATNHSITLPHEELVAIASRLPIRFRRRFMGTEALEHTAAPDSADHGVLDRERGVLWERIRQVIAAECATLQSHEKLMVALIVEDNKRISEVARILNREQKPLYEQWNRIKQGLRRALEREQIDLSAIRDLLTD